MFGTVLAGTSLPKSSTASLPKRPDGTVKVLAKSARCLSDEEIAGLATYIRNAWGNRAPVVSASDVAAIRNDMTRKTAVK